MDSALDPGHRLRCLAPSRIFTRCSSCFEITAGCPSRRLRLGDFFSRMWLENALRPRTLPVAVSRKRFLEPECVLVLGIPDAPSKADRVQPAAGCCKWAVSRRLRLPP